jgi:hypothetical protein
MNDLEETKNVRFHTCVAMERHDNAFKWVRMDCAEDYAHVLCEAVGVKHNVGLARRNNRNSNNNNNNRSSNNNRNNNRRRFNQNRRRNRVRTRNRAAPGLAKATRPR